MMLVALLFASASLFDYARAKPLDIVQTGVEMRDGIAVKDISFANVSGGRTAAYLVEPLTRGRHAAVLFVHWYEPPNPTSNRTQFIGEAVMLANKGVVSLLVETMWSEPEWFKRRVRAHDFDNTVRQAKELRRALDVLLARKDVDPKRLAYVGHDFGAMFGALLAGVDQRPKFWAFQAGTPRFADWYLYGPKMQPDEQRAYVDKLAPLDPVANLKLAPAAPVLYQFAKNDKFVPEAKALEFYGATKEPKKILWYDAEHGLNDAAREDRIRWLTQQLKLR